jgi:hypothetical protein
LRTIYHTPRFLNVISKVFSTTIFLHSLPFFAIVIYQEIFEKGGAGVLQVKIAGVRLI